jgi:hypothetical protein
MLANARAAPCRHQGEGFPVTDGILINCPHASLMATSERSPSRPQRRLFGADQRAEKTSGRRPAGFVPGALAALRILSVCRAVRKRCS